MLWYQSSLLFMWYHIIVISDSIHAAKKIFNSSLHPLQKQSAFILKDLREFFNCCLENVIEFWECLSKNNWHLHKAVNTDTKSFYLTPLLSNKLSWDFSKKVESDSIINKWRMTFKCLISKVEVFLTSLIVTTVFLNHLIVKIVLGLNFLATPTHFALEQWEL